MKRGEIYYANLNPTQGSEIQKVRPVLIVSNDQNNKAADTITVIPISSKVERIFSFEIFLSTKDSRLQKDSKAMCQQIRTISKQRITGEKKGDISNQVMEKIEYGIQIHLDMNFNHRK